jgi:hypothetical protein
MSSEEPSVPWRHVFKLCNRMLAHLAHYGPAGTLVFGFFVLLAVLGALSAAGIIGEEGLALLGGLGLAALWLYLRHTERMARLDVQTAISEVTKVAASGQNQRKARRARLPPRQQALLPLDLPQGGAETKPRESDDV